MNTEADLCFYTCLYASLYFLREGHNSDIWSSKYPLLGNQTSTCPFACVRDSQDYFKICFFIRHIHNYTEHNQQWIVSQVRSMDSEMICNTTQENIHKYRYKKWSKKGNIRIKRNAMCNKIKCTGQCTVHLINNNISRNVKEECANRLDWIYT